MRVLLIAALALLTMAGPVQAYSVSPEVFWFIITDHGQRVGFGRGQYQVVGQGQYNFHYVLVLHLPMSKTGEIGDYRFDKDLRPVSFDQKTLFATNTQSVTNTADGNFDYTKGMLHYKATEFDKDDARDVPIPPGAISLFSANIALAHTPLAVGKKLDFTIFSAQTKSFVQQHFEVLEKQDGQYHMKLQGDDSPGRDRSFWFLLPTRKHPNGYTTLTTFNTPQGDEFRLQAASREQALQGFEDVAKSMGL